MRQLLVTIVLLAITTSIQAEEKIRFRLSMDGFGNCTVGVESTNEPLDNATEFRGEAVHSSRLPNSSILKNKDGLVRIVHDFAKPDEFDVLFPDMLFKTQNARLDRRFKALSFTTEKGDEARVTYAYRIKPPFTIIYDRYPLTDKTSLQTVISMGTLPETLAINLFTHGRSNESSAKLGASWFKSQPGSFWNGSKQDRQQSRTQLLTAHEFNVDQGVIQKFRLPIPNAQIEMPCFLSFNASSSEQSVQEISGLLIEGHVTSLFGIGLDERRGVIFIKQVLKGSLAEQAGLQTGDVIVSINDSSPKTMEEALSQLGETSFGDNAVLEIERAGKSMTISITSE